MYNKTELDIHDTSFDEVELNMLHNTCHWKLEDSEQYKLIEQSEKENAITAWSQTVQDQANLKHYRDK